MLGFSRTDRPAEQEKRIRRHEDEAFSHPDRYRQKVLAVAYLGYAVPFLFLGLLLALAIFGLIHAIQGGGAATAAIKLTIASLLLAFAVGRSMIVRFDPPDAKPITRDDAPDLFKLIDEVRVAIGGAAIDEVYLDDDLNASIQQAPRFGLFGGHVNRLVIGLPLMQALSTAQFKGVIAHEYGHLAGSHGKTGAWIYRTRAMWSNLRVQLEDQKSLFNAPLSFFVKRYEPYFDTLSFPLARAEEFEADQVAASIVSGQTLSDALMRCSLGARYLEEIFWPTVEKHAGTCTTPNVAPLKHSQKAFSSMSKWKQADKWEKAVVSEPTDRNDTHPSLPDRINAVDATPRLLSIGDDRAYLLLGSLYEEIRVEFDQAWRENAQDFWERAHRDAQTSLKRLSELDKKAEQVPLTKVEAQMRAELAESQLNVEAAVFRYKEAIVWHPEHAGAWLGLGRLLARQGDEKGLKCLEKAARLSPSLGLAAATARYRFYTDAGNLPEAKLAISAVEKEERKLATAAQETKSLSKKDEAQPHDMDEADLKTVVDAIARFDSISHAYLVRKDAESFKGYSVYHLILVPSKKSEDSLQALVERLERIELDHPWVIHFAVDQNRWMAKWGAKQNGAEITPSNTALAIAA
ncbi:MAG: M48 family metalloprotease [Pseudomonadota bacterium]